MKVPKSASIGQGGVHAVAACFETMGWLFREQPVHDFGIDATVEVVSDERATGQLLAVQIKAGESMVSERDGDAVVFRGSVDHLDYWLSHALPVIVVLWDPVEALAYWGSVTSNTVVSTGKGWKLLIPTSQVVGEGSRDSLAAVAAGDPYVLRLRRLRLDKPWMEVIADGGRLVVEADEWINKTSGRGEVRVRAEYESGSIVDEASWQVLAGLRQYREILAELFPWAALYIDEEIYETDDRSQFELETGSWDGEDGVMITFEDFDEWRARRFEPGIRPLADDGEVACWRLEADLNDLATSFLRVDQFLDSGMGI